MVCFDLGGVLARINRTWQGAAKTAGIQTCLAPDPEIPLADLACFDEFQAGKLGLAEYLDDLAVALGVNDEQALAVHNCILVTPYDGTEDLIALIKQGGSRTSCLSNTNAPHWEILRSKDHFPGIASLEFGMASHEVKMEKPNTEIFRHFEATVGAEPDEIVFFDDSEPNIKAAKALGWRAYWIDHEKETAPQIRRALEQEGISL